MNTPVAPPALTPAPDFPALADRAAGTYNSKSYTWATHWGGTGGPQLKALADNAYTNAQAAYEAAAAAGEAATAAGEAATAAGESQAASALSATTASTQAGIATTQAGIATAAAGSITAAAATASAQATLATTERIAAQAAAATASAVVLGVSTGLPTAKPLLLLDFANSRFVDGRVTCALASASTRVNESGVNETVAANTPRLTFDAATGQCLGKMGEEGRTNSIRNNTMLGAVVGVVGSGGALPTNWINSAACTLEVIAIGVDAGVNYVDLKFSGTTTGSSSRIFFDATTTIAASTGQTWAASQYLKLVAGSLTNISSPSVYVRESTAGGTNLIASTGAATPTSALTRFEHIRTLTDATVARVVSAFSINHSTGVAIDITVRIGLPALELGNCVTSVIPTAGSAVARAAESAYLSGSNFSSWYKAAGGTIVVDGVTAGSGTHTVSNFWSIDDGTSLNRIGVSHSNAGICGLDVYVAGSLVASIGIAATLGTRVRIAATFTAGGYAISVNGSAVSTGAAAALPVVDRMHIGAGHGGTSRHLNGRIRNLAYYAPGVVSNAQLPLLSAIA